MSDQRLGHSRGHATCRLSQLRMSLGRGLKARNVPRLEFRLNQVSESQAAVEQVLQRLAKTEEGLPAADRFAGQPKGTTQLKAVLDPSPGGCPGSLAVQLHWAAHSSASSHRFGSTAEAAHMKDQARQQKVLGICWLVCLVCTRGSCENPDGRGTAAAAAPCAGMIVFQAESCTTKLWDSHQASPC